tara:strand:+ start:44 stop:598 length:555 start_codon:yes stop_codon:yes gene_type:complete
MKNNIKIIIITGPSGVGKGTVIKKLLKKDKRFGLSISATTRKPRIGEVDGKHYYFLSKEKFKEMVEDELFVEWAKFADNYYGTPFSSIKEKTDQGLTVILEIEVEGASQIKEKCPNSLSVFLMPPNKKELERRIRDRGTESEESISKRLKRAEYEINSSQDFDFIITNETVEATVDRISEIISN